MTWCGLGQFHSAMSWKTEEGHALDLLRFRTFHVIENRGRAHLPEAEASSSVPTGVQGGYEYPGAHTHASVVSVRHCREERGGGKDVGSCPTAVQEA